MNLNLLVWRQPDAKSTGKMVPYRAEGISPDSSFLEMLDFLNEGLTKRGEEPVVFDSDCREGICGTCGFVINGIPHGPQRGVTVCQLHMRTFKDGDTIVLEPWRARPFPVVRDLSVDRSAFDRIIAAGGYTSVNTNSAPEANSIPVPREDAERAMDAAACIGCGACVAACKNASAVLFLGAKVSQFALLPQGRVERRSRVLRMLAQHDAEGFGACSNEAECQAVCPKEISISNIARMAREYVYASATVIAADVR